MKWVLFLTSALFYFLVFFTNFGNYLHGGNFVELIFLQTISVLIILLSIKIFSKIGWIGKLLTILVSVVPLISLVLSFLVIFE